MEEDDEMEEDEFFGQPGLSQDYRNQQSMQPIPRPHQLQQPNLSFRQPGPSQDHHHHQQFRQPSPRSLLDPRQFQLPDLGRDYQQSWNPALQQGHQQPLQPTPFSFIPPELESREAQGFSAPTPTIFGNIGHMQESNRERERARYSGRLPIDLPGIRKVFVYDPRRPPEERRGEFFQTGVIKVRHSPVSWSWLIVLQATGDITVTAPLPSQRDLPPMRTTPLPIAASPVAATSSHPYARQRSTNEELKRLMEAAKSNMRRKILLENAMPETRVNVAMAEAALSAASQVFMSGIAITQIPRYETCLKTLCTLTTTIRAAFKTRARREIPTHYDLNRPSDANAEVTHRQQRVPPLVENHAYLFVVSPFYCVASESSTN